MGRERTSSGQTAERVSRAKHAALPDLFHAEDNTPCGFSVHCAVKSDTYSVSIDKHGTLMWPGNQIDDKPLLCIVSEDAPAAYLEYLRNLDASYIAVGEGRIDIARAMDILNTQFGISRVAVVGGGNINGAFLNAGLLDEINPQAMA